MKIAVNTPTVGQVPAERSAKQLTSSGAGSSPSVTQDHTTLNLDSNAVKSLTSQALQTPAVRQDKVDAIRQSINAGQYKVDPEKVASSIIASQGE
jgi:negative regulator of flagellin synthesis FlgM